MTDLSVSASQWVESILGDDVVVAKLLPGGMSSKVHRLTTAQGDAFVVRHITDEAWLQREPDLIVREAIALDLLVGSGVVAPRHLASSPAEGLLLMTLLPGRVESSAGELRGRTGALAAIAASIADAAMSEPAIAAGLPPWRSWVSADPQPPTWGNGSLWSAAIEMFRSDADPPRTSTAVLLHRDLHPLNVLWNDERPAGIVDWVNACVGHPHAEVGHCRWNLAVLVDQQAADSFLHEYLRLTDSGDYDPWWDLATALSFLPGPIGTSGWHAVGRRDLTDDHVIEATERFLRQALRSA